MAPDCRCGRTRADCRRGTRRGAAVCGRSHAHPAVTPSVEQSAGRQERERACRHASGVGVRVGAISTRRHAARADRRHRVLSGAPDAAAWRAAPDPDWHDGRARRIRGAIGPPVRRELPPERKAGDATVVSVLTKMGIPIFLQPSAVESAGGSPQSHGGRRRVLVPAREHGQGARRPERGGRRRRRHRGTSLPAPTEQVRAGGSNPVFTVPPPSPDCSRLRSLAVECRWATRWSRNALRRHEGHAVPDPHATRSDGRSCEC